MTENEEINELVTKVDMALHGEHARRFLNKVTFKFFKNKVLSNMEIRMLKQIVKKQTDGKY